MDSVLKKLAAALVLLLMGGPVLAQEKVTVFAAASLANAMTEVGREFEAAEGIKVRHAFASSATLAKQIGAGAPADVFVSANVQWMDYLETGGRLQADSRRTWLGNRLVLVVPLGQALSLELDGSHDLASRLQGRLCIGNVASVPAGIYAKQALSSLGWWDDLQARIVGAEDVRAALAFVERGECAAGIVYASDAKVSQKVRVAGVFPEQSHEPIVYPMALLRGAGNPSRAYWQYLHGPAAKAIFARHGFRLLK